MIVISPTIRLEAVRRRMPTPAMQARLRSVARAFVRAPAGAVAITNGPAPAALVAHMQAEAERMTRIANAFPICPAPDPRSI